MQLASGTLLQGGKYKIEKVLGQGSFGITYLAEHMALGKKVCIKEFFMKELNSRGDDGSITGLSDGSLSYNYAQKFRKEAQNLARMEHPNIVKVTDSFDENATFYYVMEYIEGQDLNTYIKQHALSEAEAVAIIKDVANALIYMHEEKHMLHLDLKPGNVMRRNSDGHIFLIDFGLSKHYSNDGQPETSTTIGLGTAGYAPIEQADQAKNGEFRPTIDVYALGATLYKLLTRETPPTASEVVNDDEILAEKLNNNSVSPSLIDLIVKAMKPGYKKRIQTAREFIAVLSGNNESETTKGINEEETIFDESTKIDAKKELKPATPREEDVDEEPIDISESDFLNKDESNKNNKPKSKIIWYCFILILLSLVGVGGYITHNRQYTISADLRNDIDTLSYSIGLSQTEGLREFLVNRMGVDTAYVDQFVKGLNDGVNSGDDKKKAAYFAGIQIGQQISNQMIPSINHEIYGEDSTKTISLENFMCGFIDGATNSTSIFSAEQASEIFQEKLNKVKGQYNANFLATDTIATE